MSHDSQYQVISKLIDLVHRAQELALNQDPNATQETSVHTSYHY